MIRPLVIDAKSASHLVSTGILTDRVAALAARMEAMPPGDPAHYSQDPEGWLRRKGYANGQVRTFALSVFSDEVVGAEPSDRILRVCRDILDPRTEIVTDQRRLDEINERIAEGVAMAGAVGALWRDGDRFWGYEEHPLDGAPMTTPNGQMGAERHCPIPEEVLRTCFDTVPRVWCLAMEGGNRKYNLRWCRPSGPREIDLGATPPDPLMAMRIVSAHAHLLPRHAA